MIIGTIFFVENVSKNMFDDQAIYYIVPFRQMNKLSEIFNTSAKCNSRLSNQEIKLSSPLILAKYIFVIFRSFLATFLAPFHAVRWHVLLKRVFVQFLDSFHIFSFLLNCSWLGDCFASSMFGRFHHSSAYSILCILFFWSRGPWPY